MTERQMADAVQRMEDMAVEFDIRARLCRAVDPRDRDAVLLAGKAMAYEEAAASLRGREAVQEMWARRAKEGRNDD